MPYKTILVSLNDLAHNLPLLHGAAKLARDHDAHLQGIYVIPAIEIYAGIGFEPIILEERRESFRRAERGVRRSFETILDDAGIRGAFEAVDSASPDITDHVIDRARRSDITIISQPSEDSGLSGTDRSFAERLLLSSGRPTIVVPRTDKPYMPVDQAIVGWSGTREAARAVFDSIPLLKSAGKVTVVWVDPERAHPYTRGAPEIELATALSRHGINAAFEPISTGGQEAGEVLLKAVADCGAQLLVMGAYGHYRLSEMILGGATRTVLGGMTCPVLFSH